MFNKDILSNVNDALLYLENFLRLKYDVIPGEIQRREILEIPKDALREALVNAVTHRDYFHKGIFVDVEIYDDRVEISNFGGLPKGLSKKEFGKKSVPRNFSLATLMLRVGDIEKMGTGVKKMRYLIKEAGLPPIRFEIDNFFTIIFSRKLPSEEQFVSELGKKFRAKFRTKFRTTEKRANNLLKILDFIENHDFSITEFAQGENRSYRSIQKDIHLLKEKGLVLIEGGTKARKYKITEKYKKLKKEI